MKKFLLTLTCIMAMGLLTGAKAQVWGLKTSATMLATLTSNLEVSMSVADRATLHLPVMYNPWKFEENSRFQQLTAMPGVRLWKDKAYFGAFASAFAIASRFHMGGFFGHKYRYDGNMFGIGVGGGYAYLLSKRWNIEFELGVGFVRADYDKCAWQENSRRYESVLGFKLVPAKLDISVMYLF